MPKFPFLVTVEAETEAQATTVMVERIGHDEDLGFDYTIDWVERIDEGDWFHQVRLCAYCKEAPRDPGYDRCAACRTWRDPEWCEVNGVEHGVNPNPVGSLDGRLYEKCGECHLFVEPNDAWVEGSGYAKYIHLARGDDADERIEGTHDAWPSGMRATLRTWKVYGPSAMRERFVINPEVGD